MRNLVGLGPRFLFASVTAALLVTFVFFAFLVFVDCVYLVRGVVRRKEGWGGEGNAIVEKII